jgi:hypothetical protein
LVCKVIVDYTIQFYQYLCIRKIVLGNPKGKTNTEVSKATSRHR